MNILIPVLTFGPGGGHRVLSKLADELIRIGHHVAFLCPDGNKPPYFPTLAEIKWADRDGNITAEHNSGPSNQENALSIQKKLKKALYKIPKSSYDLVIANHSLTVIPIKRTGWGKKTLYYVQAYEPDMYKVLGGLKNRILSYLSQRSYSQHLFTVVNSDIYLNYKKLKASRTLYPGIDFKLFYPQQKQENNDRIIIGTVGRAERFKGTQYILDAFGILKKQFPTLELHIAYGNADDYEAQEGIHCFQPHGDEALATFYRSLDYYFCAGFIQLGAFHYPVVEAMCCGIPVITTQYYPSDESNAWLIRPQVTADIVSQFEKAHSNPELKNQKLAQALKDVQQLDWKTVGEKFNGYLDELHNALEQGTQPL
jgi:glycosyltransferase involved in cell wall biosynthesis